MKCLFIYNPNSGKKKVLKYLEDIKTKLNKIFDEVKIFATSKKGDIKELIKKHCIGIDAVIVAGGDGTISEAVNSIMHLNKKLVLGILPFGTVNDISRNLGIPKNYKKALSLLENKRVFKLDVIKINNTYGVYVLGGGLFTETSYNTSQNSKKVFGKIAYVFHALKKFIKTKTIDLEIEIDKDLYKFKTSFFLIVNSKYVGGQRLCKQSVLNDGKATLILFQNKNAKAKFSDLCKIANLFLFGIKKNYPSTVFVKDINSINFTFSSQFDFNLDGEKLSCKEAKIEIIKEGLNVFF